VRFAFCFCPDLGASFGLNLVKAALEPSLNAARDAGAVFTPPLVNALLYLVVLLPTETMLRSMPVVRRWFDGLSRRIELLEWEIGG